MAENGNGKVPERRTLLEIWITPAGQVCLTSQVSDKFMALGLLEAAKDILKNPQPIADEAKIVSPQDVRIPPGLKLS